MVNVSGMMDDNGNVKDHFVSHVYLEVTSRRGGNEVVIMIMKTLHHLNFLDKDDRGYAINILFVWIIVQVNIRMG